MYFIECYKEFLSFKKQRLKEQSFYSIEKRFNSRIIPYFREYKIEEITPQVILNWQTYIDNFSYTYAYKKALFYSLVSFYKFLELFGYQKLNIPLQVGCFKDNEPPKEQRTWSTEEFKLFLSQFEDNDIVYKSFFIFAYMTGARVGELLALKFSDINNGQIFISKTISKNKINGNKIINSPKSKKGIRYISLDNSCIKCLENLKKYYKLNLGYFKYDLPIFNISDTSIKRRLKKYSKLANIPCIRVHDLRHSNATILIKNNCPLEEVSRRLGHSNINTTIKIYSHLRNSQEKRVLTTLNSLNI